MTDALDDAPALSLALLGAFVAAPPRALVMELERYIWNNCIFAEAIPFAEAQAKVRDGSAGFFVYHQKSGILFTHVSPGTHQLLMAYLASLHKIDFDNVGDDWSYDRGYKFDATSKLADSFIFDGYGLYRSSVSKHNTIMVGSAFAWTSREAECFQDFRKTRI